MNDVLLGQESAEVDTLLYKCAIPKNIEGYKSIITGRWGTGKTAVLLLRNEALKRKLEELNVDWREAVYINESAMDIVQILSIKEKEESLMFNQKVEIIWKGEIIRRAIMLLNALLPIYKHIDTNAFHWKIIKGSKKIGALSMPLWKQIPNILKFIGDSAERSEVIDDCSIRFSDIFQENIFQEIQKCLRDIKNEEIQPRIIVEPIDTPTSALEEHTGMAQTIITSLLNIYQSNFIKSDDQLLRVDIAVPWHRYSVLKLNFPQKLIAYKAYLSWTKQELRNFINIRLNSEFENVGRGFSKKGNLDEWDSIFVKTIANDYCYPSVTEGSFEYILRHTHHRPRELQRITRMCIETCSKRTGKSVSDVLKGSAGIRISANHIKEAIRNFTIDAWTMEIMIEAERRFMGINEVVSNSLYGLPVPFAIDDLKKRESDYNKIMKNLDLLWQAGIIGIQLKCLKNREDKKCSENCRVRINILPSDEAKKKYTNKKNEFCCKWTFFEYNWSGDQNEIIHHFQEDPFISIKYIIHPKGFETLLPKVSTNWPVGI